MIKTFDAFLSHCRTLQGETLLTGTRSKPFSVEVDGKTVFFLPSSSNKRRRANPEKTERVLRLLDESGEWSPGAYQAITYHASYILAVAKHAAA